jgi:hypothetical protein
LELAAKPGQIGGMTASSSDAIAVLRIEIEYIEPLIWRRVAVRTSMNLKALHKVIQAAMGWLDYHLWDFTADERRYGILIPDDPDWNRRINNAASTKLSALLTTGVTEFGYMYETTGSIGSSSKPLSLRRPFGGE